MADITAGITYATAELLEGPADGAEYVLESGETWPETLTEHGVTYVRATFPEYAGQLFYLAESSVAEYIRTRRAQGIEPGRYCGKTG